MVGWLASWFFFLVVSAPTTNQSTNQPTSINTFDVYSINKGAHDKYIHIKQQKKNKGAIFNLPPIFDDDEHHFYDQEIRRFINYL